MSRTYHLAALFLLVASSGGYAQQSVPSPTPPRSPTYPTPAPVPNAPAEPAGPQRGVTWPGAGLHGQYDHPRSGRIHRRAESLRGWRAQRHMAHAYGRAAGFWRGGPRPLADSGAADQGIARRRQCVHPGRRLSLARSGPRRKFHDGVRHDGAEQDVAGRSCHG